MIQNASCDSKKITKEIRFAVVMYGGVSLAIYMNGIAQELLSMAKATSDRSREKTDQKSSAKTAGTASVYKELAEYLSKQVAPQFNHKFVVDIISGTSAGGINGVCLAKGLVRGLDDLKVLEKIWLDEGNIDKLLNDRGSEPDLFCPEEPKTSLFNSQRMFAKLLEAFKSMENAAPRENGAAHVKSLDLFVTATDLRGLQLPIELSDGKAFEHIYKHVFPFKYRFEEKNNEQQKQPNHFTGEYDPLLAFASRCTSSFPTAFEPVKIADALPFLKKRLGKIDYQKFSTNWDHWKHDFFRRYENTSDPIALEDREFADGGYLDNRPFGHAIKAIHEREADCPLERKLLFIDPAPEAEKKKASSPTKEISFLKNTSLAALELPRHDTIRQEINSLHKRNHWVCSVNQIVKTLTPINKKKLYSIFSKKLPDYEPSEKSTEKTVDYKEQVKKINAQIGPFFSEQEPSKEQSTQPLLMAFLSNTESRKSTSSTFQTKKYRSNLESFFNSLKQTNSKAGHEKRFDELDLDDMVKLYGDGYPPYHFTKIDKVTDFLGLITVRGSNIHEESLAHKLILLLIKAWRNDNFNRHKNSQKTPESKTENTFIANYDIDFRIRRLLYFRSQVEDAMISGNSSDESEFKFKNTKAAKSFYEKIAESLKDLYRLKKELLLYGVKNPIADFTSFLSTDVFLNANGHDASLKIILKQHNKCSSEPSFDSLVQLICAMEHQNNDGESWQRKFKKEFLTLMQEIHSFIMSGKNSQKKDSVDESNEQNKDITGTSSVREKIESELTTLSKEDLENATKLLFFYNHGYELQDLTTFQLLAGGEYGEGTNIDLHRISPLDATNLWDEAEKEKAKLAGIALGSFGGFLDREWRRNDIMWGRLDGAERLIAAILPGEQHVLKRQELIDKAHHNILRESVDAWLDELQCSRFSSTRDQEHYNRLQTIRESLEETADKKTSSSAENKKNAEYPPAVSWKCVKQWSLERSEILLRRVCPGFSFRNPGTTDNEQASPAEQQPGPQWKKVFQDTYEFHRKMEPEPSLKYLGRASGIASSMIDRLEEGQGITKKISSYLKKLNAILLGLLDFSTPKTFMGVLFGYWMHLFVLVSATIITGSYLATMLNIPLPDAFRTFGFVLLGISLFILLFKRFLTTNVHQIKCRLPIRWLSSLIIFFLLTGLFFVLIALYDTVLNHGGDWVSGFVKAYGESWTKLTDPVIQFFKNLFGGG